MLMWRLPQTVLVLLAVAGVCGAQQIDQLGAPKLVTLRLIVSIEGDLEKAANVTVELMDAVGFGGAMDRKLSDNDGTVIFRTLDGLHRYRITGPDIEPYEGDLEIVRGEIFHMERVHVRRAERGRRSSETPPGGLVAAARLRVPASARKTFEKGAEAMRKQLWQESRTLFESAIREYPQYDMAYNGLGAVQMQLNDVEAARQSFSKAIELNPDFAGANRNLARILLAERKNSEALPLLMRSLTAEPQNAWALTNAANSELLLHDFSNAILHARKAHAVPHQRFAMVHIVAARALEATQKPAEALAEYHLYLEEEPGGPNARRAREAIARITSLVPTPE
jgi:tetratricopeptide (TPR) repeat protein